MLITIIAFFIRDGVVKNIPLIFFLIFYPLCFILLEEHEILPFFMFLIPLSVGPLLYYVNVVFGTFFVLKNKHRIRINRVTCISFILVLWETLHIFTNVLWGYDESIIKLMGFSLCLFVTVFCISNKDSANNYVNLLFSWCVGLAAFCSILLFRYVYRFGISNFMKSVRRFGWVAGTLDKTSTTLLVNPNTLGKLVILTVFCLLTMLKFEKKHILITSFMIIYFTLFGIMSGSRGFALVGLILLFMYISELLFNLRSNKKEILILTVVVVVITIFATNYMKSTLDIFSKRMQSKDISGSRFKIFKQYIQALSESPYIIFGSGMQNYTEKYNISYSTHNIFIEVVCIWGIIGLFIVSLWFISLYKSMNIKKGIIKGTIIPYLPLLGLFLKAQSGQFFISYYHVFPTLILAFLNVKYAEKQIKIE